MFIIHKGSTNEESRYESRDQLLQYLDDENAKCRYREAEITYALTHVNEDGEVLDRTTISLPINDTADALLLDFGRAKDKRRGFIPLRKRSVTPKEDESTLPAETVLMEPTSDTSSIIHQEEVSEGKQMEVKSPSKVSRTTKVFPALAFLSLVALSTVVFLLYQDNQRLYQKLENRVRQVEQLQTQTHPIDTFSRYFLPNYFSGNVKQVEEYFYSSVNLAEGTIENGTLQSVILESVIQKQKNFQVTYVLFVKSDDEKKNIRLTFDVKEDTKATHGYLVISQPTITNYP